MLKPVIMTREYIFLKYGDSCVESGTGVREVTRIVTREKTIKHICKVLGVEYGEKK